MTTISQALIMAGRQIEGSWIENSQREAELLLEFILEQDRAWVFSHGDQPLSRIKQMRLNRLLRKRIKNCQPLAYIIGTQPFLGLTLQVTPAVLIPRPETEYFVELIEKKIRHSGLEAGRFLDVGTGSGAIAIALKKAFPKATVLATDISHKALSLAGKNALTNNVKIQFIASDLLVNISQKSFDLIVANLPYVPENEWSKLSSEITHWEPKMAVTGGSDGLSDINRLIAQATTRLQPKGWLALEIGTDQVKLIRSTFSREWPNPRVEVHNDLTGQPRFVFSHSGSTLKSVSTRSYREEP